NTRWCLVIAEHFRRGGDLYVNNSVLLPISSCTLLWMVFQSSVIIVKHTQRAYSETAHIKHTQHTVNPLITPNINPFLPSVSIVSVLFISTDHCIRVTGDISGN
ncbi:unnamed protein product, partial [Staurois parvus]